MFFDHLKCFITYDVLHLTRVAVRRGGAHPYTFKKFGKDAVTLIHLGGALAAFIGKLNISVFVYRYHSVHAKKTQRAAYTRLGISRIMHHVNGAHLPEITFKHKNTFKVHLARVLNIAHVLAPFLKIKKACTTL